MKTSEIKIKVRYGETDQMQIVYHPNYYVYFELGRTGHIEQLTGMSYRGMEAQGILLPLTETHCKYKIPAKYDDELTVKTTVKEMTVARIIFGYQLYRDNDGALLAEGETAHAFVNAENRPINLKKHYRELFDKLCETLADIEYNMQKM